MEERPDGEWRMSSMDLLSQGSISDTAWKQRLNEMNGPFFLQPQPLYIKWRWSTPPRMHLIAILFLFNQTSISLPHYFYFLFFFSVKKSIPQYIYIYIRNIRFSIPYYINSVYPKFLFSILQSSEKTLLKWNYM